MFTYPVSVRFATALRLGTIALMALAVGGGAVAHAQQTPQQTPKYTLDTGGQQVQLEAISFGNGGASQPESGAATLRRHLLSDSPSLQELARTGSQPKLYLRFRDAQSNGLVQYNFDDVKFGRYTQVGSGPNAVETLSITYDAFAVSTPGSLRRPSRAVLRAVARAPRRATRSAPRRQAAVPGVTLHNHRKKSQIPPVR